jgi:hypothetical protein
MTHVNRPSHRCPCPVSDHPPGYFSLNLLGAARQSKNTHPCQPPDSRSEVLLDCRHQPTILAKSWFGPKVFPDDEYRLENIWVFVDFWRRLGISYAGEPGDRELRIRFSNGATKLTADEE